MTNHKPQQSQPLSTSSGLQSPQAQHSSDTSLYLHFPFCETKCHYCDFYSIGRERTKDQDAPTFEQAMIQEINLHGGSFKNLRPQGQDLENPHTNKLNISTIFFGGGTPSMTPPDSMEKIVSALHKNFSIYSNNDHGNNNVTSTSTANNAPPPSAVEWTMEANPSSIEHVQFKAYRSLGINRVSMGVQSTQDHQLKQLGRVHDSLAVPRALDAVFSAGFDNVSCDLLCGAPGQTIKDLDESISTLLKFPLNHISIYLLTLPKHHFMYSALPNDETQIQHLHYIHDRLCDEGFDHYEISNFCRPGHEAKHNMAYWTGKNYIGLGPSAHSFFGTTPVPTPTPAPTLQKIRTKNYSSLHKWANELAAGKSPIETTEELTFEQLELEKWMLALRLADGFPVEWLTTSSQKNRAEKLINEQVLIPVKDNSLRVHPKSWPIADSVVATLALA